MNYHQITLEDVEYLKKITAPDRVLFGEEIEYDYHHDEMPEFGTHAPDAVVFALSTEEVSHIMKYANEHHIPVVPRGQGTGLAGGSVAIYGGIMLSLERMNRILEIDLETMTAVVEPGVMVMELAAAAEEAGVYYPPEPGEKTAAIGGNAMTNAGGMKAVRYGVTRSYVVSMECVMPNGDVMQFGSNVAKNTSGYDIKDLIIGSEGTLCIATKLRMRLIAKPKVSYTLLVPFENLDSCIGTVQEIIRADLNPTAVEYLPKRIIGYAAEYLNKVMPHRSSDSYLILMFDGNSEADVEQRCDAAADICLNNHAVDVFLCNTDERKDAVWTVRSAALEAQKASCPDTDECDIVVPRNRVADFARYAGTLEKKYQMRILLSGHAGDGNLHIQLMKDELDWDTFHEKCAVCLKEMYEKAKEFGGQVSGEHGIGFVRTQALADFQGEAMIRLFEGIKRVFDPNYILNPGKVIGLDEAPVLTIQNRE